MRTVILMAGWGIADAIRKDWVTKDVVPFCAWVLVIAMVMDITEFIVNLKRKK